jgi:hypothetical protein
MNEATVLLFDHNRNEIMVRNDAFLVETACRATKAHTRRLTTNVDDGLETWALLKQGPAYACNSFFEIYSNFLCLS